MKETQTMKQHAIFRIFCGFVIIIVAIFALLGTPAQANNALFNSEYIETGSNGKGMNAAIRAEDLFQGNGDITNARLWIRFTYNSGEFRTAYHRVSINCLTETYTEEFWIFVKPNGETETEKESDVHPILPDSRMADWATLVCTTKEKFLETVEPKTSGSGWEA